MPNACRSGQITDRAGTPCRGQPPLSAKFALQNHTAWGSLAPWEDRSQSAPSWQFLSAAHTVRNKRENYWIAFSSRTWRCKTMRKTESLRATVRLQSADGQASDHFTYNIKHARKIFLEHEILRRVCSTRSRITPDAACMRFHRGEPCPRRSSLIRIRQRAVFATHLSPANRSPLARTPETGRFWARGKAKSR